MCSVTHQHPLQTAQTVALSPVILPFQEADSVAQAYQLLTNIYSLALTGFLLDMCRETGGENNQTRR